MAAPKEAWGVEIGQSALKAVKLRELGDRVEAVDVVFMPHAKILSRAEENTAELVRAALSRFVAEHPIGKTPVIISVPGHHTLARFTKLPPVDPKKVPDIVNYEAEQQIPFDLDEVIWDYQVFREEKGDDVEVGIFAIKRDLIATHLGPYTAVGIEPAAIQAGPLALFNALQYDGITQHDAAEEGRKSATVILDIGADNADLVIAAGNGLWTRTISIGGNAFTDSLVKSFKLTFSKAENLKRSAPTSKYARQIFQAMRPVFADLVAEVQRSIGFFSSTRRDVRIARMIAVGNAFKMPGLQKFVQQNLGIEVIRPEAFKMLVPTSGAHPAEFAENMLGMGTVYGLALQGLGRARVTSNLLPKEIARQNIWRRKQPWFAGAAACLLLAAGIIWARHFIDKGALASNIGSFTGTVPTKSFEQARLAVERGVPDRPAREYAAEWIGAAEAIRREFEEKSQEEQRLTASVDQLAALQKHKTTWLRILADIHAALPREAGPLGEAKSATEFAAAVKAAGVEREKRRQIWIEEFDSYFDVNVIAGAREMEGKEGRDSPSDYSYAENDQRQGFVLILEMRTPHDDGPKFIEESFIKSLLSLDERPSPGYFFDRIRILSKKRVGRTATDLVVRPSPVSGGATFGSRTSTPARSAEAADTGGPIDPLTGESMEKDWRCTVLVAVVLGEPPREEGESGQ